jgi:hypothetical protein
MMVMFVAHAFALLKIKGQGHATGLQKGNLF